MTRTVALAIAAASVTALVGCGGVIGAEMTFDDVERGTVTEIVLAGGSGDVRITTGSASETRVKRVIRRGTDPGEPYQLAGTTLTLNTDCSHQCRVSYEVTAPAGVQVRGKLGSGDLNLTGTGAVDLDLTAGDVTVADATGPVSLEATSGDLTVTGTRGPTTLKTTSGDLKVLEADGPVEARATAGDATVALKTAFPVTAVTNSGDIQVDVPRGDYRLATRVGGGDLKVAGLDNDPTAKNVIEARSGSGDVTVTAIR